MQQKFDLDNMQYINIDTPKGKRKIGPGRSVFIVAEMSGNHNQSFARAKKIIDAAAHAGADAIKLQTYTADTLTIDSRKKYFKIKSGAHWKGKILYQLYKEAYTPWDWQPKLKKYAEKKGLVFFSAPFDETAVEFLEKLNVPMHKIAGYEMADIPLLKRVARTRKPVIMSAAMASAKEIALSVKTLRENGTKQLAVLHCVNAYPAAPEDMNVNTIPDIIKRFKVISGLSDHSLNNIASIASVALGGSIIEKHLTFSRKQGGVDESFSLEPHEFKNLVQSVRDLEKALGKVSFGIGTNELPNFIFRRSIFVVKNIKKGEAFTKENTRVIRPGNGLAPKYYDTIIGWRAAKDIARGTPLVRQFIKKGNIL